MYTISSKYKQFWFLIIKLTVVVGAGYFIYEQTFYNQQMPIKDLFAQVNKYLFNANWIIPLLLGMTLVNWFLEILKWKILVKGTRNIGFYEATKQSLSSHTLSLITPFKLGEYGGKALYYSTYNRRKILLLNLVGNSAQLVMTLLFGVFGIIFFIKTFDIPIHPHKIRTVAYLVAASILFVIGGIKMSNGKGGYYQRLVQFSRKQSWNKLIPVLLLSFLRYLVFSHQFYFLLYIFNVEIAYSTAMLLIFTMYFMATLLPTINLFDFVIKGSVAVYLFSFVNANEMHIISISLIMWLLNFALPAIIGSYFVMVFKAVEKQSL